MNLLKRGSFVLLLGLCLALLPAGTAAETEDEELRTETVDAAGILQAGELLLPAEENGLLGASDRVRELADAIADNLETQQWDGEAESVTVNIDASENYTVEELKKAVSCLLNSHPELFYVKKTYKVYSDANNENLAQKLDLYYDTSYSSSDVETFDTTVKQIINGIDDSWSPEQRALYLHDYIVTHCEYDMSLEKHNAYNMLVQGSAVCEGYALAFRYLTTLAGLECEVITSDELNHAWNVVTIDDDLYYVDCTWDDPTGMYYDYCDHKNFLRSRDGIVSTNHTSTDWLKENGSDAYTGISAGTDYDTSYWSNCTTAIPHIGQLWAYAYVNTDKKGVVAVHNYADGSDKTLYTFSDPWKVWNNSPSSYGTVFVHLATDGKYFYASCPQRILRLDTEGAVRTFYTLSDTEKNQGYIYGIRAEGADLVYRLYTSYESNNYFTYGSVPFGTDPDLFWAFIRDDNYTQGYDSANQRETYTYDAIVKGEDTTITLLAPLSEPAVGLYCWYDTKYDYPTGLVRAQDALPARFSVTSSNSTRYLDSERNTLRYMDMQWTVDGSEKVWTVPGEGGAAKTYSSLADAVDGVYQNWFRGSIYFVTRSDTDNTVTEVYFLGDAPDAAPGVMYMAVNGKTVDLEIKTDQNALLAVAAYTSSEDGRMISCAVEQEAGSGGHTLTLNTSGAACIKVFLLDPATAAPLCAFHEESISA